MWCNSDSGISQLHNLGQFRRTGPESLRSGSWPGHAVRHCVLLVKQARPCSVLDKGSEVSEGWPEVLRSLCYATLSKWPS